MLMIPTCSKRESTDCGGGSDDDNAAVLPRSSVRYDSTAPAEASP